MFDENELIAFEAALKELVEGFGFETRGENNSLGREIAYRQAERIIARSSELYMQATPDGKPWPPNSKRWHDYKLDRFQIDVPGIYTGQTLSLESMAANIQVVSNDELVMEYGTNRPAVKFSTTGEAYPLASKSGRPPKQPPPTDTQKAEWMHERGHGFWGFDSKGEDEEALVDACYEYLDKYINEA